MYISKFSLFFHEKNEEILEHMIMCALYIRVIQLVLLLRADSRNFYKIVIFLQPHEKGTEKVTLKRVYCGNQKDVGRRQLRGDGKIIPQPPIGLIKDE